MFKGKKVADPVVQTGGSAANSSEQQGNISNRCPQSVSVFFCTLYGHQWLTGLGICTTIIIIRLGL